MTTVTASKNKLLTHIPACEKPTLAVIADNIAVIKQHIQQNHKENAPALLHVLDELTQFEFGRFLIKNSGALSGYWTHYLIQGFDEEGVMSDL